MFICFLEVILSGVRSHSQPRANPEPCDMKPGLALSQLTSQTNSLDDCFSHKLLTKVFGINTDFRMAVTFVCPAVRDVRGYIVCNYLDVHLDIQREPEQLDVSLRTHNLLKHAHGFPTVSPSHDHMTAMGIWSHQNFLLGAAACVEVALSTESRWG